jgi:hypothetical protein
MLVLIQEALKAGTELGFPLTRLIAHAEAAVSSRCGPAASALRRRLPDG